MMPLLNWQTHVPEVGWDVGGRGMENWTSQDGRGGTCQGQGKGSQKLVTVLPMEHSGMRKRISKRIISPC